MASKHPHLLPVLLVAAVLLLLSNAASTSKAQGLPVDCVSPPNANGTFPFPIVTSNFCGSLGLDQPTNELSCGLWSAVQSLIAFNKGKPLGCYKQAPLGPTSDLKGEMFENTNVASET